MDNLNNEEATRAKMLVNEIDDMLNSIRNEVLYNDYISKTYIQEKLSGIKNDISCLDNLTKEVL